MVSEPPVAYCTRLSDNTPSRRSMNPAAANLWGFSSLAAMILKRSWVADQGLANLLGGGLGAIRFS
jgi:hypothetical protein